MTDDNTVRLNPDAEALLGLTAAVDNFTNSLVKFGHLLAPATGLDPDFRAEVQETASVVMKRFRNEIEQSMTTVVPASKRGLILTMPMREQ